MSQPFSQKTITRVLVFVVVVLSLLAGYYHSVSTTLERSFARLEKKYAACQAELTTIPECHLDSGMNQLEMP